MDRKFIESENVYLLGVSSSFMVSKHMRKIATCTSSKSLENEIFSRPGKSLEISVSVREI